jgi:hypothetical protein
VLRTRPFVLDSAISDYKTESRTSNARICSYEAPLTHATLDLHCCACRLLTFEEKDSQRGAVARAAGAHECLSFEEFFVSMYNYCTQNHGTLVRFSFRVISDGKPYLTELDVGAFVALLYTDPGRNAATTASMMQMLDSESTGRVTWEAFEQNEKKLGSMLYPAFRLQKQLRRKVRESVSTACAQRVCGSQSV